MNARTLSDFLRMLVDVRTSDVLLSPAAKEAYYWDGGRVIGFLSALRASGLINFHEESRMYGLFCNAAEHSRKPFPGALNAGPCIRLWDLRKRNEQAREVGHVDPVEVPVSAAPCGLRLLCLLLPARDGYPRSLPVHTMHRMPPYARISGRYYDGAGVGKVALDSLNVPGGTGFYLRETHARPASAEVLARCVRQRQTDALRPRARAIRVGELSHGH